DNQIREMAGKPGFRSSEACSVKKCHGLARGYLQEFLLRLDFCEEGTFFATMEAQSEEFLRRLS
ncbi:MAG: hypothetical protein FD156_2698, partial [Nitrospirae bacterium]